MAATTIKIDSSLRDRLNEVARERGVPVGSFVDELFAVWLREQRFARLRDEIARTPAEAPSHRAESDAWDATWDATGDDGPAHPTARTPR